MFQALSKPYALLKACLGFQKGMLWLNIAPPKPLRATALLSPVSAAVFMQGKVERAQLTSVQSPWSKSQFVSNSAPTSHLTAAGSPATLYFSPYD